MLNNKIEKSINEQINAELHSGYLYLSMSAYFQSINLKGFANWMYVQYQEEVTHAMKFYHYVLDRGGKVVLTSIESPTVEWASPTKAFEDTLKHEQYITQRINNLVDLAIQEKDHATNNLLQWYVAEQVEEEANAMEVLEQVKRVEKSNDGLFMLDKELALRVFVDPTAKAGADA